MFDAGLGRRAGAAVISADEHDVGMRLGDAGGNGSDADFGDELDADPRMVVGVFQVVNELRQVLNRVNIMMRRRGD